MNETNVIKPVCDYVNITFPPDIFPQVEDLIYEHLSQISAMPNGNVSSVTKDYQTPFGGNIRLKSARLWGMLSVSGGALTCLRNNGLLASFFAAATSLPHRISTLHVAYDVPLDSAPILKRLAARAKRGSVYFGKQAVKPSKVSQILRQSIYEPHVDTGTVYLGNAGPTVMLRVYDKRNERLDRGHGDIGPTTRYEFVFGRHVECSVADILNPLPIFFHHATVAKLSIVLDQIGDSKTPLWTATGEGYPTVPTDQTTPYQKLLKIKDSPEFAYMIKIADSIGPHGRDLLTTQIHTYNRMGLMREVPLVPPGRQNPVETIDPPPRPQTAPKLVPTSSW